MINPLCLWRTLWRSRKGQPASGCAYVESPPPGGVLARVQVLTCETCGHVSIGWSPAQGAATEEQKP